MAEESSLEHGTERVTGNESHEAGDLKGTFLSYLVDRGLVEAEPDADEEGIPTYRLTSLGFQFLEKLHDLLDLFVDRNADHDPPQ